MAKKLQRASLLKDVNAFCPGCGHGTVAKLLADALDEMGVADKAAGALAVGCACLIQETLGNDWVQSPHGRACAVAAGIKRSRPDKFVFSYQGDGDAGSIGIAETIYSAKRNEKFTTIFINNGVFGMTGGQAAPTSLEGQIATTAKNGVDYEVFGEPLHLAEIISSFNVGYVARGSIANFREYQKTKEYVKKAIKTQMEGKGYSFIEIMAPCPTNWKMSPTEALDRIENVSMEHFKCGELKG